MHAGKQNDQGFEDYRRERQRVKAKLGPQQSVLGYENQALRELEEVEAAEVRDQQLSREVHEFFAAATKQAAAIVEKVALEAEEQAGERLEGEVEGFLMDTLGRMNGFIMTVMQQRRNSNVAETHVEPHISHLGADLDQFRYEGTTETRGDHIGQDPFATSVEDVQREFRAVVAEMTGNQEDLEAAPIEDHSAAQDEEPSVAQVEEYRLEDAPIEDHSAAQDEEPSVAQVEEHRAASIEDHMVAEAMQIDEPPRIELPPQVEPTAYAAPPAPLPVEPVAPVAMPAPALIAPASPAPLPAEPMSSTSELVSEAEQVSPEEELESFKSALKALVRQGVMKSEEARAAWQTRLAAMGRL